MGTSQVRAEFDTSSINEEDRTVDLVWSTGFKALRTTRSGLRYVEELDMSAEAINTSRMVGNPLLNTHNRDNTDAVLGVIEDVRLDPNGLEHRSRVRFARDEISERTFQKVKDKILRNTSVGYTIDNMKDVTRSGDEFPTFRAVKWTPVEISIVPIGVDPGAQIRSDVNTESEFQIELESESTEPIVQSHPNDIASLNTEVDASTKISSEKERTMPPENTNAQELAAKAKLEEKQRNSDIRFAVRSAKLEESFADQLISEDLSVEEASKRVFAKLNETQPAKVENTVRVELGETENQKKSDAIENAILHRVMPDQFQLSDAGRSMRGMNLIRMATVLTGNPYGSDVEIAKRAMSSSDLPLILANVAEKSAQKSYSIAPSTFEKWVNQRSLRNYKKHHQVKMGDFPSLSEVGEDGEYTEGEFSEGEETVQLKRYGKVMSFTEEMMVNDDLNMLAEFLSKAGASAKRLESKLVYDRLQASTVMADGLALFDAGHNNLGTAGAISETTFDELIQKLKNQKTLDEADYLDLQAAYLIAGIQNETAARKFLAQIVPNQTSSVNPFAGSVELIIDPRIEDKQWYLAASKQSIDGVVLYRLEGREQPVVSTRNKWATGAFQIKVEHVAAAQAMDYRGIAKNPRS